MNNGAARRMAAIQSFWAGLLAAALLIGISLGSASMVADAAMADPIGAGMPLSQLAQNQQLVRLGQSLFEDQNLSLKRNMSCATCHAVRSGGTAAADVGNRLVGVHEGSAFQGFDQPPSIDNAMGFRKVQTSTYAAFSPPLKRTHQDGAASFSGGNFWDGRATGFMTGHAAQEQATQPAIGTLEGQLPAPACVVYRVLHPANKAQYPTRYQAVFGTGMDRISWPKDLEQQCSSATGNVELDTPTRHFSAESRIQAAYSNLALALMAYEGSTGMSPFSSRYDQYLKGNRC